MLADELDYVIGVDTHRDEHALAVVACPSVPVPGLNFGTDMQGIFNLIGSTYKLVTVDGRAASCTNPLGI